MRDKREPLTLDDLAMLSMCIEGYGIRIHPDYKRAARRIRKIYEWASKREDVHRNAAADKRRIKALRYDVVAEGTWK